MRFSLGTAEAMGHYYARAAPSVPLPTFCIPAFASAPSMTCKRRGTKAHSMSILRHGLPRGATVLLKLKLQR